MTDSDERSEAWAECRPCGGRERRHEVLAEFSDLWDENYSSERGLTRYQVVRCAGCHAIRFRQEECSEHDQRDPATGEFEHRSSVYPEPPKPGRVAKIPEEELPPEVRRAYSETLGATSHGLLLLAGLGLRATVEAVCRHANVGEGSLETRIDALAELGRVSLSQAKDLHECRDLGNHKP